MSSPALRTLSAQDIEHVVVSTQATRYAGHRISALVGIFLGGAFGLVVSRDEEQHCERIVAASSIYTLRVIGGLEREQIHS